MAQTHVHVNKRYSLVCHNVTEDILLMFTLNTPLQTKLGVCVCYSRVKIMLCLNVFWLPQVVINQHLIKTKLCKHSLNCRHPVPDQSQHDLGKKIKTLSPCQLHFTADEKGISGYFTQHMTDKGVLEF